MIEFKNKFPRMYIGERCVGLYNNDESGLPGVFTSESARLGEFMRRLRNIVHDTRRLVFINGKMLACTNNWIRDNVHQMKAFRHWDTKMRDFLNFIIETQREDGQYYELIKQLDDYHWKFVNEDCRIIYPEDNVALVRLELEADIEYLVVEGAVYCYKVFGDKDWLSRILPKLEKGIDYVTSDPKRWDESHGLVKRPFTIDTWDFAFRQPGNDRRINDDTYMAIMHGDNSGVYAAMQSLAWFNEKLGNAEKAAEWRKRAQTIRENMFKYLWNGRFFMHELYLGHGGADNLERERLSLSNTYDMNRGVTTLEQSRSIINEYMERRKTTKAFAEWFSIDPPYENGDDWCGHAPGSYVNGAISPFTAGELARAAFDNGFEEYGWDIITRFMKLCERDGSIYFLYSPETELSQGGGPSGWGAAALLNAIDEGLAGIVDTDTGYRELSFSPRFPVTGYEELRYLTGYEVTDTLIDIRYILTDKGMRYDVIAPSEKISAHILLPTGKECAELFVNGESVGFTPVTVGESHYIDAETTAGGRTSFEIIFK